MDGPEPSAMVASPEGESGPAASVAIIIQLAVLAVAFVVGRFLEKIRFQWMGEAGAALLIGLAVGLILKGAGVGEGLASAVAFKGGIFFYILLPTIMFDAGYSLDTRMLIRNVGSVCMYAFAGTTISCFTIGLMMWAFGQWGWCYQMSFLANLTFGALISATDPVTVLAVFQRLNAQPDLYMNVFGESVLNDAVGMVLYNVISSFLGGKEVNAGSVFAGIGLFIAIFLGSTLIGMAIGLLAAFIFRSRYFYSGPTVVSGGDGSGKEHEVESGGSSSFEVGLAAVFAYGSYLVADSVKCSGIVAVVVNGMVMNMYVRPNLSEEAAHKIHTLFKTLAGLFELFVFSYIGTTMFLQDEIFNIAGYTALCLIALAVSRAFNIYPLTAVVNLLRPPERHIGPKPTFMLWWSGLRGAMAFALSVEASEDYGEAGKVMKTCTFYLIFITVLFNGGTSGFLLDRLKLRAEDFPDAPPLLPDGVDGGDGGAKGQGPGADGANGHGTHRRLAVKDGGDDDGSEEGDRLEPAPWCPGSPPPRAGAPRSASARPDLESGTSAGGRSISRSSSKLGRVLDKVRTLNDGRLVDRFDAFDRKVAKLLIHPHAKRETELATAHSHVASSSGAGAGAAAAVQEKGLASKSTPISGGGPSYELGGVSVDQAGAGAGAGGSWEGGRAQSVPVGGPAGPGLGAGLGPEGGLMTPQMQPRAQRRPGEEEADEPLLSRLS
ncbi:hypothetical protein HYH03_008959 [Edaphochlamys debaryana]|uniref:Cation/H+ exchanger transmembrane domain-containing protein n=1 Tax=Edaphochlamys debaryana TaxID=47281 RepID=A0A835Y873_9CHLO|nr:hypothetical protein HYH03_008959 [Edaphochlamys debaryana]|eukprot:KAG2492799.1 hypothetical protein HYH03_008959 [Edaphochlamys debaryana]